MFTRRSFVRLMTLIASGLWVGRASCVGSAFARGRCRVASGHHAVAGTAGDAGGTMRFRSGTDASERWCLAPRRPSGSR